jgi:hypothetical protein
VLFLYLNETAAWCAERGLAVSDRWELEADPHLVHSSRLIYAPDGPPDRADQVTAVALAALGDWDECLLWPVAWDVWDSDEDWPAFYAERGRRGERMSLESKPGHVFGRTEVEDLLVFLRHVIQSAWDAHILPVRAGQQDRRLRCSHDGWLELAAAVPASLTPAAG